MHQIAVSSDCDAYEADAERLTAAVELVLRQAGVERATISVAIVDDATIHELNRRFLEHDYPTDVLSFVLDRDEQSLDGEIVASADTAARVASQLGVTPADELLLYVVHGALHLVGYDDQDDESEATMRRREREVLSELGVKDRESGTGVKE
jgi:probable rRNA maturation factor